MAEEPEAIEAPLRIGVLHGPNLNLLGTREPEIYGSVTLAEIGERLRAVADAASVTVAVVQSNHEGALIDWVQEQAAGVAGFLVNAGGYTHSSVALRDALVASGRPYVEVHLSNVHAREPFRHVSLLADRALGVVSGFGADSYDLAFRGLIQYLRRPSQAGSHPRS